MVSELDLLRENILTITVIPAIVGDTTEGTKEVNHREKIVHIFGIVTIDKCFVVHLSDKSQTGM